MSSALYEDASLYQSNHNPTTLIGKPWPRCLPALPLPLRDLREARKVEGHHGVKDERSEKAAYRRKIRTIPGRFQYGKEPGHNENLSN